MYKPLKKPTNQRKQRKKDLQTSNYMRFAYLRNENSLVHDLKKNHRLSGRGN